MAVSDVTVQKSYDVLRNARGEICIIIDNRQQDPENPTISFTLSDATLHRGANEDVHLPAFPEQFLETAKACETVLVVEVQDISLDELEKQTPPSKDHITRVYDAKVRHEP